jgi:hypothetical protein
MAITRCLDNIDIIASFHACRWRLALQIATISMLRPDEGGDVVQSASDINTSDGHLECLLPPKSALCADVSAT